MPEKPKQIIRDVLLVFVLVTIGFALGKEYGLRRAKSIYGPPNSADASSARVSQKKITVTYAHATFRCATCNSIERMTEQLLQKQFEEEIQSGKIEWREVNFQEDDEFARRYGIVASCVVVAVDEGKETDRFQRLDKVWTLVHDPPAFDAYVEGAIRDYLSDETAGGAQ